FYNSIQNIIDRKIYRENYLTEREFTSTEDSYRDNQNANHRINMTIRQKIDSFQNIILKSSFGLNDGLMTNDGSTQVINSVGFIENRGTRMNESDGFNLNLRTNLTYRRRFRKKGRAFVTDFSFGKQDDERNALIESINTFLPEDPLYAYADSIIQSQAQTNNQIDYSVKLTYTEPIGGGKYLSFNVSHQNFNNDVVRDVYDLVGITNGQGEFNPYLSNQYQRGYLYNRGGIDLKVNKKKYNLTLGVDAQQSSLDGNIETSGQIIQQSFFTVLPRLRYNYDFSTSTSLRFDYETRFREPSLEQLQPIVDNSDPLNLYVGNPDLRPEYSHSGNIHFMTYSQFNFTSFFANIRTTFTQNKITNSRFIDSLFRQTTQPVNVNQDFTVNSFLSYSTPLRFMKAKIRFGGNSMFNRGIVFVNQEESFVSRMISSGSITLENRKTDVVEISGGGRLSYTMTRYSQSQLLNQDFFTQTYYADFAINFAKTWNLSTSLDYSIYSGPAFDEDQSIPLWRASISKYFLANKRAQLKLGVIDILNRNLGFSRTSELNYIQEESIVSLGRYFMLSLTYNLSKFGNNRGGIDIRMDRHQ
ncbi:MAG: TonB-dependent receptor, partial [Bacteroidetes bacterium]|nr:TonB-dependent receptor [Bacteroidota bacterium]